MPENKETEAVWLIRSRCCPQMPMPLQQTTFGFANHQAIVQYGTMEPSTNTHVPRRMVTRNVALRPFRDRTSAVEPKFRPNRTCHQTRVAFRSLRALRPFSQGTNPISNKRKPLGFLVASNSRSDKRPKSEAGFVEFDGRVMNTEFAGMDVSCVVDALGKPEIPARECMLPLLSKVLGYGIVAGSIFLKVPQIYAIVKSSSIQGLSVAAFELEAAGFTIALAYCLFKQLPFSAYGELVFILLQSLLCVALIYQYSPKRGPFMLIKSALYCALAPSLLAGLLDANILEGLYACQHAIFFAARLPQIYQNWKTKNTGQLSFLTNFMSFAGCGVRIFTSIQENAPFSMVVGSVLGLLTNGVLCAQIASYGSTPVSPEEESVGDDGTRWKVE